MGKGSAMRVPAGNVSGKDIRFVLRSLHAHGGHLKIIVVLSMSVKIGQSCTFVNTLIRSQRVSLKINNFTALDKVWEIQTDVVFSV